MAYENQLMGEFMVPRDLKVAERIHGFYEDIGWDARDSEESEFFTYVSPHVSEGVAPTPAYWQTENNRKIARFVFNDGFEPTQYAHGLILPQLEDLVEVCLVVPTDDDVHRIFENGGKILERHTHTPVHEHAGAQEFRFADPFNYSLRVTANPGWEIEKPVVPVDLSFERITSRDQYLAQEDVLAFREAALSDTSVQLARRAFGILANPSISRGRSIGYRNWIKPEELGLIVLPRRQVGIAFPESPMTHSDVVQVGSFLDFVADKMLTSRLYGLNGGTMNILERLAGTLKEQIEQAELAAQD